jgi:uncharacterized protein YkwD
MKRFFAGCALVAAAFGMSWGQDQEAGGVGEAYRDKGYKAKAAGIQALSVSSYQFGDPTPQEQLTLELINRARANPTAEANRFGIGLNQGLPAGTISSLPKQPLTFQQALIASARGHTDWMINTDTFSHTGTNGTNSKQRMEIAGYAFTGNWGAGENIAWKGTTGTVNLNNFTVALHEQLFRSASHRVNILEEDFDQIGIGVNEGKFLDGGTNWNAVLVTQDYAVSSSSPSPEGPFVTGVAYRDDNGNGFYDIGEGLGGVTATVMPGDTSTTTSSSGGYAIPLGTTSGSIFVTFSGGAVTTPVIVPATVLPGVSVKADLVLAGTTPPSQTKIIVLSGDLNFGSVSAGASVSRTLTISNTGKAPLFVTGITHSEGAFTGNYADKVPAGRSRKVTITFKPTALQSYSGTLTVLSDATGGTNTATETGTGVPAPVAETPVISPDGGAFTTKKVRVRITTATPKATIRYTTDGTEPTEASPKAPRTIRLKESATIKAKAFKTGYTESATATATFTKL